MGRAKGPAKGRRPRKQPLRSLAGSWCWAEGPPSRSSGHTASVHTRAWQQGARKINPHLPALPFHQSRGKPEGTGLTLLQTSEFSPLGLPGQRAGKKSEMGPGGHVEKTQPRREWLEELRPETGCLLENWGREHGGQGTMASYRGCFNKKLSNNQTKPPHRSPFYSETGSICVIL